MTKNCDRLFELQSVSVLGKPSENTWCSISREAQFLLYSSGHKDLYRYINFEYKTFSECFYKAEILVHDFQFQN